MITVKLDLATFPVRCLYTLKVTSVAKNVDNEGNIVSYSINSVSGYTHVHHTRKRFVESLQNPYFIDNANAIVKALEKL
jgi:hypothetical protein